MKRNPITILAALVRDWSSAIASPINARAVLYARETFQDEFTVAVVQSMLCNDGDWRAALRWLGNGWEQAHKSRVERFKAWAEKLGKREVRGLLTDGRTS